ncbi:MAG: hypothetical protein JXO72_13050 [Vicinamibacteria bacterium]|nr:hypothetical protein [Vicinamibacteria bacterium]
MARKTKRPKRTRPRPLRALALTVILAVGVYLFLRPSLGELRDDRERLRAQWAHLAAQDPSLRGAPRNDVAFGLRWLYAQKLTERVVAQVIDRAPLDVEGIRVEKRGDVHKGVLLGRVRVGSWRLRLDVHRVSGVLRAGRPQVACEDESRVAIVMPVSLREGRARATMQFAWNSRGMANLVCRDFSLRQEVEADIMPQTYDLTGELLLTADGETVVARPRIHGRRLRVRVKPSGASWSHVEKALRAQDTFWRCGLALRPKDVLDQLHKVVSRGLAVRLPALEPGAIRVPIRFRRYVGLAKGRIELRMQAGSLGVTPEAIWYGVSIESHDVESTPIRSRDAIGPG